MREWCVQKPVFHSSSTFEINPRNGDSSSGVCDSLNGYTTKFVVYRGKKGEVRSGNGLGHDVVFTLMEGYLDQGYRLYVDNYYTSPTLALDLYSHSTHLTGTLKIGRTGVPQLVKDQFAELSPESTPRGTGAYVRDGNLVYSIWKDTKCIMVLSSQHPGHSEGTVVRNWSDNKGQRQRGDVPVPVSVYNYNQYMGGVDRSDQLIKYYNVLRQTKKYWKTLFFHCIDIAAINAHIMNKEIVDKPLSQYLFRESLVRSLCGVRTIHIPRLSLQGGRQSSSGINVDHRPVRIELRQQLCVYCKIVHKVKRRTTTKCRECEVPLCCRARDCCAQWHHRNFMKQREAWFAAPKQPTTVGRPKGSMKPKG